MWDLNTKTQSFSTYILSLTKRIENFREYLRLCQNLRPPRPRMQFTKDTLTNKSNHSAIEIDRSSKDLSVLTIIIEI